MARNDYHTVRGVGDVGLRRTDCSVNAASCDIVNEWIVAVPPSIPHVYNLSFGEIYRYVTVGVSRKVMSESNSGSVEMHCALSIEHDRGNGASRRGPESSLPKRNADGSQ